MWKLPSLALGLFFGIAAPQNAFATPQVIRINGMAYDSTGNPVSGAQSFVVNAYTASTGGSSIWTSNAYAPTLTNGAYSIDLDASVGSPSLTQQIAAQNAQAQIWFEITYNGNVIRPRMRARGTTFALSATSTDGFQNMSISTQAPASGTLLQYNGSSWAPAFLNSVTQNVVSRAGDTMSGALAVGANVTTAAVLQGASAYVTGLTASKLLLTNGSGTLVSSTSTVTNTQLNYLVGVTGDIQAQLLGKQSGISVSSMVATAPLAKTGAGQAAGGSITITVNTANASSTGILLASDWNNFNANAAAVSLLISRTGDTMTGGLRTPAIDAVSANVSSLAPGQLVRTDPSQNLVSVTAAVSDAQLAYLLAVTAAIQPQLDALANSWSANPPGTITPFGGGSWAATTAASNQITFASAPSSLQVGQQLAAPNLPAGTLITSVISPTVVQVSSSALSSVTSEVVVVPPAGYLLCDGAAVSRSGFSTLYENVGNAWGQGNGTTTFNLPDLRGKFLRGQDWGAGVDGDRASRTAPASGGNTGDAVGSFESNANASHAHSLTDPGHSHVITDPGHSHTVYDPSHSHGYYYPWTGGYSGVSGGYYTAYGASGAYSYAAGTGVSLNAATTGVSLASVTTGVTLQSSGGTESRPVNSYVNYIIKY